MTETQEEFYIRKIKECKVDAEITLKKGFKRASAYYNKEAANYQEMLNNHLKGE